MKSHGARLATLFVLGLTLLAPACSPDSAPTIAEDVLGATVDAPDGLPVVYDARGQGDTALVLIHCWSCNRGFWREQIDFLTGSYRVVTLDLGGHGESGSAREAWTISGLAPDVVAVADELGLQRMILIAHSMGGPVALEAARLMPGRVLGIVAVDTLQDADFEFPEEMAAQMLTAFESDFAGTMRNMFSVMAAEGMDETLRSWIVEQALASNETVAVALMKDFPNLDYPTMFTAAGVPIRSINAAASERSVATNIEGNRRYADFDAVLMEGVGHFLQLQKPEEFNDHLLAFVDELSAQ